MTTLNLAEEIEFRSNSKMDVVKKCLRRYYFQYNKKWVSVKRALPLDFGLAWHRAMDVLWEEIAWNKNYDENDVVAKAWEAFNKLWTSLGHPIQIPLELEKEFLPRTPGVAREMLHYYFRTRLEYIRDKIELIALEKPFAVPMDPDSPIRFYVGYLDKVVREKGGIHVIEHKSTTLYSKSAGFQSRWLDSFDPNSQIDGYAFSLKSIYRENSKGVIVDGALVHKDHHDIFKFVPVNKMSQYINDWLGDTLYWWNYLDAAIKADHYPKNDTSCVDQYGTCPYRSICTMYYDINQIGDEAPPGYKINTRESFPYDDARKAISESTKTV